MEKFKNYLENLSETVTMTRKEQTLMLAVAALAGCVLGALISPHRTSLSGDGCVMTNNYYGKKKGSEKEED